MCKRRGLAVLYTFPPFHIYTMIAPYMPDEKSGGGDRDTRPGQISPCAYLKMMVHFIAAFPGLRQRGARGYSVAGGGGGVGDAGGLVGEEGAVGSGKWEVESGKWEAKKEVGSGSDRRESRTDNGGRDRKPEVYEIGG